MNGATISECKHKDLMKVLEEKVGDELPNHYIWVCCWCGETIHDI